MKVGVPKELKDNEYRVAITPAGVRELVVNSHEVVIEKNAGRGSSIFDDEFVKAGATILPGVSIGRDAVVAAGAIVADDVPAASLVAGPKGIVLRSW